LAISEIRAPALCFRFSVRLRTNFAASFWTALKADEELSSGNCGSNHREPLSSSKLTKHEQTGTRVRTSRSAGGSRKRRKTGFSTQSSREGPFEQSRLSSARKPWRAHPTRLLESCRAVKHSRKQQSREVFEKPKPLLFREEPTRLADALRNGRLIRERTGVGRAAAKAHGVRFGRPRKLNAEQRALALRLFHEGKSVGEIAKTFRVHGGDHLPIGRDGGASQGLLISAFSVPLLPKPRIEERPSPHWLRHAHNTHARAGYRPRRHVGRAPLGGAAHNSLLVQVFRANPNETSCRQMAAP
jgi:hypothetical protein